MKIKTLLSLPLALLVFFSSVLTVQAATADLGMDANSITFSQSTFLEGQRVRIYIHVYNNGTIDALGTVKVFNENTNKQVGTDQVVSVVGQKNDTVFVDWTAVAGSNTISAKVTPWETDGDNSNNNAQSKTIFVEQDTDRDGTKNSSDNDDDNDGSADQDDHFPLNKNEQKDTDGDGKGDNEDDDDDNDGAKDNEDGLPLDPDESLDTDKDGIGNTEDIDDDGDGLTDTEEMETTQTDPIKADTDGDSKNDQEDAFPLDPNEQGDYDQDGLGNKVDPDADNDGTPKETDKDDLNKTPVVVLSEEPGFVLPEKKISLDAGPSYDEDGQIVAYEWTVEDPNSNNNDEQKSYTGKTLETQLDKSGKYKITLKVTDDKGESMIKTFEISVFNYIPWLILLLLLIIALALYLSFKYTRQAKKPKQTISQAESTPKKAKKLAPKPIKGKKSNNNKKKS